MAASVIDRHLTPRDAKMLLIGAMMGVAFFAVVIATVLTVAWWSLR